MLTSNCMCRPYIDTNNPLLVTGTRLMDIFFFFFFLIILRVFPIYCLFLLNHYR